MKGQFAMQRLLDTIGIVIILPALTDYKRCPSDDTVSNGDRLWKSHDSHAWHRSA